MKNVKLTPENEDFLQHYGVLGMKWGVRRNRPSGGGRRSAGTVAKKVVRDTFLGIPETSLFYKQGRENFKAKVDRGKATVGKVTSSKLFRSAVFDKDNNALTKRGRAGMAKKFNAAAEKRYQKALDKEAKGAAKKKQRAAATRKLIDDLIADDKAISKKFGTNYDEAKERAYLEQFFADDLKED